MRGAKQRFLAFYPNAQAEEHKTNWGHSYWLIRLRPDDLSPFADGDTQDHAWTAALAKLATLP